MASIDRKEFTQIAMFVAAHKQEIEQDDMNLKQLSKFIANNKFPELTSAQVKDVLDVLGEDAPRMRRRPEALIGDAKTVKAQIRRLRVAMRYLVKKLDGEGSEMMKELNSILNGHTTPISGAEDLNHPAAK